MNIRRIIITSLAAFLLTSTPTLITCQAKAESLTSDWVVLYSAADACTEEDARDRSVELFDIAPPPVSRFLAVKNYNETKVDHGNQINTHIAKIYIDRRITGTIKLKATSYYKPFYTVADGIIICNYSGVYTGSDDYNYTFDMEYTPSTEDLKNGVSYVIASTAPQSEDFTRIESSITINSGSGASAAICFNDLLTYSETGEFKRHQTISVPLSQPAIYNQSSFNLGATIS